MEAGSQSLAGVLGQQTLPQAVSLPMGELRVETAKPS